MRRCCLTPPIHLPPLRRPSPPLTSRKQIESSLLGAIFDPYVRFIVWEGLREWWRDELPEWLTCPINGDPYPHSSIDASIPPSTSAFTEQLKGVTSFVLGLLPSTLSTALSLNHVLPVLETENVQAALLANHPLGARAIEAAEVDADTSALQAIPACPYTWATPLHQLNCDIVWPKGYTGDHRGPLIELDTPEYLGRISKEKTVEKLLAMGGLRLASMLNTIYGAEGEQGLYLAY